MDEPIMAPDSDPFPGRITSLRQRMRGWHVDALLIVHPVDIRYLTGFVGDDSWALVRARSAQVHVLSDFRFQEQIEREAPQVKAVMRSRSLTDELKKLVGRLKLTRIGLQAQHVTLAQHRQLAKAQGAAAKKQVDDRLVKQRADKDAAETRSISRAIRVAEQAFAATLATLEPGHIERQVAARLEYEMCCLGASGASFPIFVAADANASLPHAIPGNR
jgi:Xaa-Pro aminopeptidase